MAHVPHRPIGRASGFLTTAEAKIAIPVGTREIKLYASTLTKVGIGPSSSLTADVAQVQTITKGDATGGTFTASFQGQTTGNLTYDESAADVQTALRALSSVGSAGVSCAGGILTSNPITVTMVAPHLEGNQPLITIDGTNLTGGVSADSRTPTVAITTAAVVNRGYIEAGSQEVYQVRDATAASDDAYLFLAAVAGTGTYRVTFVG